MSSFPEILPPDELPVLYSPLEIAEQVNRLADEIRLAYGEEFMIVALLKGSFVFTADLVRALYNSGCRPQIDFMTLASYGTGTSSSGTINVERELSDDVSGKPVLIVDDILESGRTLDYARGVLRERGASDLRIAVLLEKPGKRTVDIEADFVGFTIPDHFVVGYGLDYANYYRELPFIGYLD